MQFANTFARFMSGAGCGGTWRYMTVLRVLCPVFWPPGLGEPSQRRDPAEESDDDDDFAGTSSGDRKKLIDRIAPPSSLAAP